MPYQRFNDQKAHDLPTNLAVHFTGPAALQRASEPGVARCRYAYEISLGGPRDQPPRVLSEVLKYWPPHAGRQVRLFERDEKGPVSAGKKLGCEGESERDYGALIGRLLENRRRDIHLDVVLLKPGGGDPLALVELARKRIAEGERKSESPYVHRAVLIDTDRLGQAPLRDVQIAPIAQATRMRVIWQRPCCGRRS
jgi:hypothetical protein